ncbi:type II toxin-antitoxin system HicA family toxin [Rhizobium sp.]
MASMTKADKILERMRNNPRDWSIEDLKTIAARYEFDWRQPGTSHVTFSREGMAPLTVPARKPIKPIYVSQFVAMIDDVRSSNDK